MNSKVLKVFLITGALFIAAARVNATADNAIFGEILDTQSAVQVNENEIKQTMSRGRERFPDLLRTEENYEILPEVKIQTKTGTVYRRSVTATKKFSRYDEKTKKHISEITCKNKITFTYDKESFVKIFNPEKDLEAEKKTENKNSKWIICDISEIIPSEEICLVSSRYTLYNHSEISYDEIILDAHLDLFCSVQGEIGINSDMY